MQEESLKIKFINYWRIIDKKIFFGFLILFFLGLFFPFSSTSSLAGERLNKDYYFFFLKTLILHIPRLEPDDIDIIYKNILLKNYISAIYNLFYFFSFGSYNWNRSKRI